MDAAVAGTETRTVEAKQAIAASVQKIEQRIAERATAVDARIGDLSATVEENRAHAQSLSHNLDSKFEEKLRLADERLGSYQQHTADICTNLELKMDEKNASQDLRADELSNNLSQQHKHFTEMHMRLERTLGEENTTQDKRTESQYQNLSGALSRVEAKLTESSSKTSQRLDELVSAVDQNKRDCDSAFEKSAADAADTAQRDHERMERTERQLKGSIAELEEGLSATQATSTARMNEMSTTLETHTEQQTAKLDALEKKLVAKDGAQDKTNADRFDALDGRYATLETRYSEKFHQAELRADELSRLVKGNYQQQVDVNAKLQKQVDDQGLELKQQSQNGLAEVIEMCTEHDRKHTEKWETGARGLQALAEQVGTQGTQLTEKLADIDTRSTGRLAVLETGFAEQRHHVTEITAALNKTIRDDVQAVRETAEAARASLDRKITENHAAHEDMIEELRSDLQKEHADFGRRIDRLDVRIKEESAESTARADREHGHFQQICTTLATLGHEHNEKNESARLKLENQTTQHHQEVLARLAEVEVSLSEKTTKLSQGLAAQEEALAKEEQSRTSAHNAAAENNNARLQALEVHAEEQKQELQKESAALVKKSNAAIDEVKVTMLAHLEQVQGSLSRQESDWKAARAGLEEDIAAGRQLLNSEIAKVSSDCASQADALKSSVDTVD
eukprot:COSAG03_NODE_1400_length_4162_cov_2.047502_4_plen_681_part_01